MIPDAPDRAAPPRPRSAATPERVVPVLRRGGAVLAFRHPRAGLQVSKGRVEPGDQPADAAPREVTGATARAPAPRGRAPGLGRHLAAVSAGPLPARWRHRCADDGGHLFDVFWHPLSAPPRGVHPGLRRAPTAVACPG